ncbi:glycosyltransferase family 2 protein [Paeniglutamicibacter sp. ZC-3]|uniref:glycosyltransferase n=1 Tax=Paeniglutamicibacter sp. ZC-3 TaxID=2986919 RepID=UPI0021F797CD|nr:glycosyltransferase family 2 protein [Paeniglutamicibacter sp. ZC-3]MCV9996428.1 glycosyltransferase family 2 protein [Paeniglutamicibacter sp. ZC-3]
MMGTESASGTFPEATYILPLKWHSDSGLDDLAEYLGHVVKWVRVIVVDGSEPDLFENHAARFPSAVVHLRPVPMPGANGKVAGVLTGVHAARDELLVIADDDVRYERIQLEQVLNLLQRADIVRPQNYLVPLPWHARLDTARSLVNRAFGADYPGTFALRRSVLMAAGGYDAHVLFENLELLRTIDAAGGREIRANDVFVRRPPSNILRDSVFARPMTTLPSPCAWPWSFAMPRSYWPASTVPCGADPAWLSPGHWRPGRSPRSDGDVTAGPRCLEAVPPYGLRSGFLNGQ